MTISNWNYAGAALLLTFLSACADPVPSIEPVGDTNADPSDPTSWQITAIYWSDADSGRINGERFRLSDIDAPETGGVGAAIGGAKCEKERERGFDAKEFVVEFTRIKELRITHTYGYDKMPEPRLLIDLSADGEDVAQSGIEAGFLRPWPHDGTKALAPKPDWCE
jgi:endonuclease YncB( thermonuclease family)